MLHKWISKPAPLLMAACLASIPPAMIKWCLGVMGWLKSGLIETSFIWYYCLKNRITSRVYGSNILHPSPAAVARTEKSLLKTTDFILTPLWTISFLIIVPFSETCITFPVFVPKNILSLSAYHLAFSEIIFVPSSYFNEKLFSRTISLKSTYLDYLLIFFSINVINFSKSIILIWLHISNSWRTSNFLEEISNSRW